MDNLTLAITTEDLPPTTLRTEARSLLCFVRRPHLEVDLSRGAKTTAHLFVLSVAVTAVIAVPLVLLAGAIYEPPWVDDGSSSGFVTELLLAGLFAPVFEELTFRLWLSRRRSLAVTGAVLTLTWIALAWEGGFTTIEFVSSGAVLIGFVGMALALAAGLRGDPALPDRAVPALVWVSAVAFGLAHLQNFDAGFDFRFLWLAPFLVAPQILSGLVYSYVRVRQGLLFAMLIHGLENSVLTVLTLLE